MIKQVSGGEQETEGPPHTKRSRHQGNLPGKFLCFRLNVVTIYRLDCFDKDCGTFVSAVDMSPRS